LPLNVTYILLENPFIYAIRSVLPGKGPAGRAYSGENGLSIIFFDWVFFSDIFGVVNKIVIKLTRDTDFVGIDLGLPKFFEQVSLYWNNLRLLYIRF
jgi:hypothetical protein